MASNFTTEEQAKLSHARTCQHTFDCTGRGKEYQLTMNLPAN